MAHECLYVDSGYLYRSHSGHVRVYGDHVDVEDMWFIIDLMRGEMR